MTRYPIEVFWSDEDEGYIAVAPDLPGCSAWGKTEADALQEAHDAIDAWIEACEKSGEPVPEPSRPAEDRGFSGRFLLRVPRRLHADLTRQARAQGVSLNQYVLYLLSERNAKRRAS